MNTKWNSGPPPHVGWWNASGCQVPFIWMFWNGFEWSQGSHFSNTSVKAAIYASRLAVSPLGWIKWSYYWHENARVPRINPETLEITGGELPATCNKFVRICDDMGITLHEYERFEGMNFKEYWQSIHQMLVMWRIKDGQCSN
jgi:hypothetical protein